MYEPQLEVLVILDVPSVQIPRNFVTINRDSNIFNYYAVNYAASSTETIPI